MEKHARARLTIGLIAGATFLVTFDGGAVVMALPRLGSDLGGPLARLQLVMTAFLLANSVALLPAGRVGDLFGRDRVWTFGVALFVAASALCGAMPGLRS